MAQVRYIGPLDEVEASVIGRYEAFVVPRDEVVDLPDWLVHGEPQTVDDDGEVTDHGIAGLLESPHWELVDVPAEVQPETDGAPA